MNISGEASGGCRRRLMRSVLPAPHNLPGRSRTEQNSSPVLSAVTRRTPPRPREAPRVNSVSGPDALGNKAFACHQARPHQPLLGGAVTGPMLTWVCRPLCICPPPANVPRETAQVQGSPGISAGGSCATNLGKTNAALGARRVGWLEIGSAFRSHIGARGKGKTCTPRTLTKIAPVS